MTVSRVAAVLSLLVLLLAACTPTAEPGALATGSTSPAPGLPTAAIPTVLEPTGPARASGFAPSGAATPIAPAAQSGPWILGYYAGYERDAYPVTEIDWTALTHLAVAFVIPAEDGSLDASLFAGDQGPALARALVDAAHRHGRQALASIGGEDTRPAWLAAASPANRAAFVANLVALLADYGYDGLDLDWEPVQSGDTEILTDLARRLRAAAPAALLTMPVNPVNVNLPEDLSGYRPLAAVLDQLNLMSYGMAGAYEGWQSWHSSALMGETPTTPTSVDASVRAYLAAGVPPAKLGVGAGFYGLCYTPPVGGPGEDLAGASIAAGDGTMSYARLLSDYGAATVHRWDAQAHVPYLSFPEATGSDGCGYVSYEDEQSLAEKGRYVRSKGLGGVIVWTVNQGYVGSAPQGQRNPLLRALHDALDEGGRGG